MCRFLCLVLFTFNFSLLSFGQQPSRIELLHADVNEFDANINPNADRLLGHVAFKHENAIMTCDSAWLYKKENNLEAFGNVKINQGDTVTVTGKRMLYTGDTKLAQIFDDVVMTDRKMILNTSKLDYNLDKDIASYKDSAHIVDEDNVLTSKLGYYYSHTHDMFFKRDVILVNPKFTLTCDTLKYNTTVKTSYFMGPTFIRSKENLIYCERGWYNTVSQTSLFTQNAYLKTKEQTLNGDTVTYDRKEGIGTGYGHVSIFDSTNKVLITGDYAKHHEEKDSSFVTGHATMIQILDKDSLFMHGDTLKAVPVDAGTTHNASKDTSAGKQKNLFAWHHVKMFKKDMQGMCDSVAYTYKDSTIRMFTAPILWSGLNQLTADSISIQMANSKIDKMYLTNSAFIVSRADTLQNGPVDSLAFNQIKGKNMTGYFEDNKLHRIDVNGNGQTIYYTKNKKQKLFGVNRADCSDLVIKINENKVQQISLLKEPDGNLYPIKEISTSELRLKGFNWAGERRPMSREEIY